MFKNSAKILFLFAMISGSLITISANSWLGAWMGLEINLLSFIPLMINNNLMSSEASLKYFLTQTLASMLFLFSIITLIFLMNFSFFKNFMLYSSLMINSTLLLKSGAAPFHFWFPTVMEGLSWINNFILMTWQKIAPMILISYNLTHSFLLIIIWSSIIIGSLGGLNQTSLRKLMAFSSINHLGWMLAALLFSDNLWLIYLLIYSFLTLIMTFFFKSFNVFYINQLFSLFMNYPVIKFFLLINLLSLGGLPPFLGFLPKWLVIQSLTMNNFLFLIIVMVMMTLITLYFYIRICYSAILFNSWELNWNFKTMYKSFNFKILSLLSFISSTSLIFINMFFLY
uniref:NADH-ubiquinone oxidoreductase chain 2 n=1 Tax=Conosia irrorata TaxID=2680328 RepID=A0A7T8G429_9DIPT|nr:NADH dehydrogenase subunit 2 [Conosia irrorata]QQP21489.1 NADH dehydrogenase subunit 2 [Conosia irrorata]